MDRDPNCLFCKIIAGELPAQRIYEDDQTIAIMDINPATRGHLLVLPRNHSTDLTTIAPEDLCACARSAQQLAQLTQTKLQADGVNLINSCGRAAWQTVFHFHIHVIPRYQNDPLRLPWTPAPGEPKEIEEIAELLRSTSN